MRRSPGPRCERTTGASPPKVIAGITTGNHSIECEDFRGGPAQPVSQFLEKVDRPCRAQPVGELDWLAGQTSKPIAPFQ
jgi:hypothetical protein